MSTEKLQGGAMGGVEELYREVILDHFKAPKNKGKLPRPNAQANGMNPLCGDQLSVTLLIDNGVVKDVKYEGHGCAISQSAASMLTQAVKDQSIDKVRDLARLYKEMFGVDHKQEKSTSSMNELGDLISLEGVKKYPVRIKCALLSCNTILEALENYGKR